jgi:hypothetical protein
VLLLIPFFEYSGARVYCVYCKLNSGKVVRLFYKFIVLSWFFIGLAVTGMAQYGNEWIHFNQQYFKIPVAKEGIYRLTYSDLVNAGFPSNTNYNHIQLFHRGIEQHIRIEKNNTGIANLEPGDYIEFYGVKNTGVSDQELYQPASSQPHQYYNLFSDTTAYFLTINTQSAPGQRMSNFFQSVPDVSADQFHYEEKLLILASQYSAGMRYNESGGTYVQKSIFDIGEGWSGQETNQGQSRSYVIEGITSGAVSYGDPQVEVQLVGRTRGQHPYEIAVGPTSGSRVVSSGEFSGFNVVTITAPLNWSDIGGDGKITIQVRALSSGTTSFRLSASYIKIRFPQTVNMGSASEKVFTLAESMAGKSYVEIQNPPSGTVRIFDITNPSAPVVIGTTTTSTLNAVIDQTNVIRKILVTNTFITPTIKRANFRNINAALHNYIIISHKLLMSPAGGFTNPVKEYAAYRTSPEGGGFDTLVVDIKQLYNQFNYGEVSPMAVRRFMHYMVNNGSPKYLFIIGKGLEVRFGYHRNPSASNLNGFHSLVPTAGEPASDILYTVGLGNNAFEPAVPTGRISVSNAQQVADYLKKVKEMEAVAFDDLWRKNILHLSGGLTTIEQGQFKFFLQYLGQKAEDFYLGGKITSIAKNTTDLEFINISDKINTGVQLVTMFGHSGTSTGEFNVGYASAPELGYNNKGKYPMFLANGCNAGDFFSQAIRWPEDWVFTANKGAIAFMANTNFGFTEVLNYYSNTFYNIAYRDQAYFEKGVGDVQKEVVRRMINGLNAESDTVRYLTQAHQMFLLGDPAVKIFGAPKPDYEINDGSVFESPFSTDQITALTDSFAINIVVRNFGMARQDSLRVRVTRTFGENVTLMYDSVYAPVLYRDTLVFVIPRADGAGGENHFKIEIDPEGVLPELNELNNEAEITLLIPSNAPRNLFPPDFSIVASNSVSLTVQSFNVLDEPREFIIELDTVPSFSSQYLKQETVFGRIATHEFNLLNDVDTLAYYWRTKFSESKPTESDNWVTSSFTYINNGNEGWAQVHFPQFASNPSTLVQDSDLRKLKFKETITPIAITTAGRFAPGYDTIVQFGTTKIYHPDFSVKVGGTEFHPLSLIYDNSNTPCVINTLNSVAFSKTTTQPYILPSFQSTVRACGRRPEIIASFTQSNIGTFLAPYVDYIAVGDSVVLFSVGNPGYSSWSVAVRNKLNELGISNDQINAIVPGEPIMIFARKGSAPGTARIVKSEIDPVTQQMLRVEATITGRSVSGAMTSPRIGPAVAWQNFYSNTLVSELPQTDEISFDIIGESLTGTQTMLIENVTADEEDLSAIDAAEFPYLYIKYNASDEINLTPPQLKKWLITYTPAAEGAIVFNDVVEQKVVDEGEQVDLKFSFQNISQKEFTAPLTVQYTVNNTTQRKTSVYTQEIAAPTPGTKTDFTLNINSLDKTGLNDLRVFVNPRILPELYYDNNIAELKGFMQVIQDVYRPVLDVTVDGRYLHDGDYVSSNPVIKIQVWDENNLILKSDTLGVNIFLKSPCCNFKPIFFTRADVTWGAASTTAPFTTEFTPQHLEAGDYTLRVQASDARNNNSGAQSYEINFTVEESNAVYISKPYPNPSAVNFFYDVTVVGDELPDAMVLQIMNTNGSMVNELRGGNFFTGTNTFVWNGTDARGNFLPSGLYLYRVLVLRGGKSVKAASGKMLLSR